MAQSLWGSTQKSFHISVQGFESAMLCSGGSSSKVLLVGAPLCLKARGSILGLLQRGLGQGGGMAQSLWGSTHKSFHISVQGFELVMLCSGGSSSKVLLVGAPLHHKTRGSILGLLQRGHGQGGGMAQSLWGSSHKSFHIPMQGLELVMLCSGGSSSKVLLVGAPLRLKARGSILGLLQRGLGQGGGLAPLNSSARALFGEEMATI